MGDLHCFSCPNCDTWVVNLSDHLRKTHRIASPVDRKPLLRMARLEKRRMTESATNSSTNSAIQPTARQLTSTLVVNGLAPSHPTNEIENLLFKHEQDSNPQQFAVTFPENILLNHPITHFTSPPGTKRARVTDDHTEQLLNGPLSSNKKSRLEMVDGTKLSSATQSTLAKPTKKNRNKSQAAQQQQQPLPQQQQQQPQTIIKTAASGIFPQQPMPVQHMEESSDDVSLLSILARSFDCNSSFV